MKRSVLSGLKTAEALFHQDWIRQYEFTCWGFLKKNKILMKTQIDRVSLLMSEHISRRRISKFTLRQKGLKCCVTTALSIPPPLKTQWVEAVGSEQRAHSEVKNCWKLKNYRLWTHPIAVLPTASQKRPVGIQVCMETSAIRKEWWKPYDTSLSCFVKETRETQKIFGKPIGELKLKITVFKKRTGISYWTMKILATEYYGSKRISGLRKQDEISMVIRITTMLIVNLMNILCFLITIYSVMDYC